MPTLEELLRTTLKGANEKFDRANQALHAAVVSLIKAVEAATEGRATVHLKEQERDETGVHYSLAVVEKGTDDGRDLAFFHVPSQGFPIHRETRSRATVMERFGDLAGLTTFFNALVSDPESPLISYLAYIMRNSATRAESSDAPVPF